MVIITNEKEKITIMEKPKYFVISDYTVGDKAYALYANYGDKCLVALAYIEKSDDLYLLENLLKQLLNLYQEDIINPDKYTMSHYKITDRYELKKTTVDELYN